MADQIANSAPVLDLSTKLAFDRIWVAYARTMLAWVRTATTLITFGFSVYKILSNSERRRPAKRSLDRGAAVWAIAGEHRPRIAGTGDAGISPEYSDAGSTVSRSPALTSGHRGDFDLNSRHPGLGCDDFSPMTRRRFWGQGTRQIDVTLYGPACRCASSLAEESAHGGPADAKAA
jgi:Domain of unknown function (DUF202)